MSLPEAHYRKREGAVMQSGATRTATSYSVNGVPEGLEKLGLGTTREEIEREVERARARELSEGGGGRFAF